MCIMQVKLRVCYKQHAFNQINSLGTFYHSKEVPTAVALLLNERKLFHKWGALQGVTMWDVLSASVFVFTLKDESSEYLESHAGASA